MTTLRFDKRKANKGHVCNYCGEIIEKGEYYYNSAHEYEGSVYTWKSHENCSKLLNELGMDGDEGITQEIFVEYVDNAYYDLIRGKEQPTRVIPFKERLEYVIDKLKDKIRNEQSK